MQKVLFLTNNSVSQPLVDWLSTQPGSVSVISEDLTRETLQTINPDWVISYSYKHIIKSDLLALKPNRFLNLHISYLPFNRGADPNIWSFLEDTPKGVTIHLIDQGLDTGPILVQREVNFDESSETLGRSYLRLHEEIQKLFQESWVRIFSGEIRGAPQVGAGTFHRVKDLLPLKSDLLRNDGWDVKIPVLKMRYLDLLAKRNQNEV